VKIDGQSIPAVFILGAGATRGAVPHVLVNKKRIKAPLNYDFFKIAEAYARARGATSADAKRLERLKTVFKSDLPIKWPPPMEAAFSLLYTAKDFPEIYKSGPGKKPDPGERQELEDFLSLLFDILYAVDHDSRGPTGYDRLASALEASDSIITLNYDTLLDSALLGRGWDPAKGYAIGGAANKFKWKPQSKPAATNAAGVKLLKLHGSLNWWVPGTNATLANVFSKKPSTISPPRSNSHAGKIRQIIPPIYGKVFAHSHWRTLWKSAFAALCDAELLVVVGCSIVDTDYHLQALLRRVSRERKKRGDKFNRVILVDRVRIRRKWQAVLKGSTARYEGHKTLEAFLKKGLKV
jgi:hypothetical protein